MKYLVQLATLPECFKVKFGVFESKAFGKKNIYGELKTLGSHMGKISLATLNIDKISMTRRMTLPHTEVAVGISEETATLYLRLDVCASIFSSPCWACQKENTFRPTLQNTASGTR